MDSTATHESAHPTTCVKCRCGVAVPLDQAKTHAPVAAIGRVNLAECVLGTSAAGLMNSRDERHDGVGPAVSVVRGYTVRVWSKQISLEDGRERRKVLAQVLARAMRK